MSPKPDQKGNKLQRPNSNFCKPLKNNSEGCPSNQVSAAAMTSTSDKNRRSFNCHFSRVGLRTYQHPCKIQYSTLYIPWLAESIATCKFTAKCLVICRRSITNVNRSDCCFSAASIHMLKLGSRLLSVSAYNSTRVFAADTDVNTWEHHLTCWKKTSTSLKSELLSPHTNTAHKPAPNGQLHEWYGVFMA